MDKILLSSLSIDCIVGIWEWERRVRQTVVIDIEFAADIRRAAASDRIEDAVDYKKLSDRVRAFVSESQYQLLEALAENTAQMVLREFSVSWIKLSLCKPAALGGGAKVSVVVERTA